MYTIVTAALLAVATSAVKIDSDEMAKSELMASIEEEGEITDAEALEMSEEEATKTLEELETFAQDEAEFDVGEKLNKVAKKLDKHVRCWASCALKKNRKGRSWNKCRKHCLKN